MNSDGWIEKKPNVSQRTDEPLIGRPNMVVIIRISKKNAYI